MNFWYKCLYYVLVIGLCLSGPALLIGWKWGVEPRWGTVDVVQAARGIDRGARLSEADLKVVKVKKELLVSGAASRLSAVLHQETVREIRPNEQITDAMLNTAHLLPGPGEWNMPLPAEWTFGKPPGSLLRGDRISLLLIPKEEAKKAEEKSGEEMTREKMEQLQIPFEEEQRLTDMVVSFAKGTNNQEISSSEDRKKTTGVVNTVEVIVTEQQKELIRKYGMQGYKFLIIYH
ncbi:SAF domain-containing protein [Paenibacillus doosanensis]|uniref:SAF domain-containing protein n=1 Tax=Paenibacillus konkukensis TaxID=2020716 RepID=A0ABY4RNY4_9BACL|nr:MULTISPECIES: SAF domain-containing protein [Paenibacillus]MCS7461471.1 SAF domain-containing protein [Paenibacillus doosanensis]UQZ83720.1 hypothetical protein SK3146_02927 [Paenibacillus konkukensis]